MTVLEFMMVDESLIKIRIAALEAAPKLFDPDRAINLDELLSVAATLERWLLTGAKAENVLKVVGK